MAGRSKPPWAVFEGGPLYGQRRLLSPDELLKPLVMYTPAGPEMWTPHEYRVTMRYKLVEHDIWTSRHRILEFVRSLPDIAR